MVFVCVVTGCKHRRNKDFPRSFHSFPFSDPKRLEEWIRAVSRESKKGDQWRPTQFSRICSDHFNDDDYVEGTKIKTLRSNAVPFQSPTRLLHKQPAVKTPQLIGSCLQDSAMHTEEPPPINFCDLQERAKEFYSALLGLLPYVESFQNQVYKVKPLQSCADGGRQSQLELLKGQLEALVSQVARMKSTMHVIRGDLDKIQNDSTSEVDTFISATAVLKFESPDDHDDGLDSTHGFGVVQSQFEDDMVSEQREPSSDNHLKVNAPSQETQTKKSMKCYVCGETISRRPDHMRKHHPGVTKYFPCSKCDKEFENYREYQKHVKLHARTTSTTYRCDLCNKTLKSRRSISKHIVSHNGERPYVCDVCGRSFKCRISLAKCKHSLFTRGLAGRTGRHFIFKGTKTSPFAGKEKHEERQNGNSRLYSCSFCPKTYTRLRALKQHTNRHTGVQPYKCQICDENFYTSKAKGLHDYEKHHGEYPGFKCKICGEMCRSGLGRETHYLRHTEEERNSHNIIIKMTECDVCGKVVRKNHLTNHKLTHSAKDSFICEICGKGFRQAKRLKQHAIFHMKPEDRPVRRPRFSWVRPAGSQQGQTRPQPHQKVVRNFSCNICGKNLISKFNLIVHSRIHTGEKPYTCDLCGKSFRSPQAHKAHAVVHTKVKPFKCNQCGQAFNVQANLKRHYSIHTGQKPFQCDFCGKSFIQKTNLEVHRRIHTGEKPYQCNQCGKKFSDPSTLYKHKSRHEKDVQYSLQSL